MKEKGLLMVSIVSSVAGLAMLFILSQIVELGVTNISQITPETVGQNVKVCGEITSKFVSDKKHVFLELKDDSDRIDIVIFNSTAEKLGAYDLLEDKTVCFVGKVDVYQGKLEIIPNKIELTGE